jgi:hypothetical protein
MFRSVRDGIRASRWVLPKTWETTRLLSMSLSSAEFDVMAAGEGPNAGPVTDESIQDEASRRFVRELQEISAPWVIGSSLAFEAIVLLFAYWLFARRDF